MIHGKEALLPRVDSVEPLPDYLLLLTFKNGEKKQYDAKPLLQYPMYKNLEKVFSAANVQYGTVVWPGDLDISPDTLYLKSTPLEPAG